LLVGLASFDVFLAFTGRGAVLMDDSKIAAIARSLAEALQDWAYTRKDEDKKRVTAAQTELVQAVKGESE
jgi:hypothetical protein